ncbi:hypothetical protein HELRODRAFT_176199 [Helobdella robusta]|uniref:Uncharacterized protein n=1 Tax=Helobdella robusta TaxID=6412 RepID=T1FAA6_HELRO|nr:hypothetical protein HELRODRAFT_176199 [Helobdella robusta]ESN99907.1 hypothetical protein HELRODRAFT_176199 [Helobdella robusta]
MAAKYKKVVEEASDESSGSELEEGCGTFHQIQSQIFSALGKAITCEYFLQYCEAVSLYRTSRRYLANLWIKLRMMQKKNIYKFPENMTEISRSLHNCMNAIKSRAEEMNKFREHFSSIASEQVLDDLDITVDDLGSNRIKDMLTVKKALKRLYNKNKAVRDIDLSDENESTKENQLGVFVRRRRNTIEELVDFKKIRCSKDEDFFNLDEATFKPLSEGKIQELIKIDSVDVFLVSPSSALFIQHNCCAHIYHYEDRDEEIVKKCYVNHYFQVGIWIYPLHHNVTPMLKQNDTFFFPDFSSEALDQFVAFKSNSIESQGYLEALLENHCYYIKEQQKPKSIKCVGEVASSVGILFPKYFFSMVKNELNVTPDVEEKNYKIVDDVWRLLHEEPTCNDLDIIHRMKDAAAYFQYSIENGSVKYDNDEQSNDPCLNSAGVITIVSNNAIASYFICKLLNSKNDDKTSENDDTSEI